MVEPCLGLTQPVYDVCNTFVKRYVYVILSLQIQHLFKTKMLHTQPSCMVVYSFSLFARKSVRNRNTNTCTLK